MALRAPLAPLTALVPAAPPEAVPAAVTAAAPAARAAANEHPTPTERGDNNDYLAFDLSGPGAATGQQRSRFRTPEFLQEAMLLLQTLLDAGGPVRMTVCSHLSSGGCQPVVAYHGEVSPPSGNRWCAAFAICAWTAGWDGSRSAQPVRPARATKLNLVPPATSTCFG